MALGFFFNPREKSNLINEGSLQKPILLKGAEITAKLGSIIPLGINFIDHLGKEVLFSSKFEKLPVILILSYYKCPMLCNLVFNGVLKMLQEIDLSIGSDFNIISLSIDPEENCKLAAKKRRNYLSKTSLKFNNKIWPFLVGKKENILKLANSIGFGYVYDKINKQYAHSAGIFIISPNGELSKIFYGISFKPSEIKFALIDAANGKIGSLVDKIILSCFNYDPDSHRYGVYIFGFMRLIGTIILILLILLISILRCMQKKVK